MIVDDLAQAVPGLRGFVEKAHIIQAPFPVSAFEDFGGGVIAYLKDEASRPPEHLVPKRDVSGESWSWDSSWARSPYENLVLTGSLPQKGIITVRAHTEGSMILMSDDPSAGWGHVGTFKDLQDEFSWHRPWDGPPIVSLIWADLLSATRPVLVEPLRFAFTEDGGVYSDRIAHYLTRNESANSDILDVWRARCRRAFLRYGLTPPERDPSHVGLTHSLEGVLECIVTTLALMNCRNIVERPVVPTQPRASRRRGEPPPYRYHVLEVKPFKRTASHEKSDGPAGDPVAIHWVRGHFKHYTDERPLLGRFTGTYWWQPHLAGRAPRVVTKSYALREAER